MYASSLMRVSCCDGPAAVQTSSRSSQKGRSLHPPTAVNGKPAQTKKNSKQRKASGKEHCEQKTHMGIPYHVCSNGVCMIDAETAQRLLHCHLDHDECGIERQSKKEIEDLIEQQLEGHISNPNRAHQQQADPNNTNNTNSGSNNSGQQQTE
jgi:hypothetical protein